VQNQVPKDGCVIPADRGALYMGSGTLDVGLVTQEALVGYQLYPLLQNDLPELGQEGGTEPNRIALREFRVRVELAADAPPELQLLFANPGLAPYLAYREPWSGSVDPGGGNTAASVTAVPAEIARQIAATGVLNTLSSVGLFARVTAVGDTMSDAVESHDFLYPIFACNHCLISYLAACPYAAVNKGNVCNVAQDGMVDCCSDGQTLQCPARGAASTN